MWWGVREVQKAPTAFKPGILHDSQACYQVEPRIWGLLKFWKILNFNNFGFIIPLVSLSLFPTWACGQKEKSEHEEHQLLRAAGYSISKIYVLGMQQLEKEWVLIFVNVYTYYSHYFLATEATHLKTKQQESEWGHSPFGSDQKNSWGINFSLYPVGTVNRTVPLADGPVLKTTSIHTF